MDKKVKRALTPLSPFAPRSQRFHRWSPNKSKKRKR